MKQNAGARHHKRQLLAYAASFGARHKIITAFSVCIIVLATAIGWLWYANYSQKFSKEDFDQLTTMAKGVLEKSGGATARVSRTCSYEHPGEFGPLNLYCRIEIVSYVPYENDLNAVAVGKKLEAALTLINKPLISPDKTNFYGQPSNNIWTAPVNLRAPYPSKQCNFSIQTNNDAKRVLSFPEKTEDNLIALSFECSAESRGEYFPVTYRQG